MPLYVVGLAEFNRELRQVEGNWSREVGKVHRQVAKKAAEYAQAGARSAGGLQAKEAGAIKGSGSSTGARLTVTDSPRFPAAQAAFWGALRKSGWQGGFDSRGPDMKATLHAGARPFNAARAAGRADGRPNLPVWVGSAWRVAQRGEGPHAINAALARHLPELTDEIMKGLLGVYKRAYND